MQTLKDAKAGLAAVSEALLILKVFYKTNMELVDKAFEELNEIKPMCMDTGMTYEERVEKREEEIKKLIDDMITRLLEEANADAEKEGWCDTEMGKSKVTRDKRTEEIDGLDAAIVDGKATIMKLTQEVAERTKEIEDLDAEMTQATELRTKEKAKNKHVIMDAMAAQAAVSRVTQVLKDFYEKAAQATALVQTQKGPSSLVQTKGIKMGSEEWKASANPNFQGSLTRATRRACRPSVRLTLATRTLLVESWHFWRWLCLRGRPPLQLEICETALCGLVFSRLNIV